MKYGSKLCQSFLKESFNRILSNSASTFQVAVKTTTNHCWRTCVGATRLIPSWDLAFRAGGRRFLWTRLTDPSVFGDGSSRVFRAPPGLTPIHFLQVFCRRYISDTICRNFASILDFSQTCQILVDQTYLADSDASCKILASQDFFCKFLGRILQDNI